jgi:beta-glucanase (GH16 family)
MLDLPPDLPPAHLVFEDRFESFSHDHGPWRTRFKWDGIGAFTLPDNGELQLYVDPAFTGAGSEPLGLDPFRLEDSALVISAMPAPPELDEQLWGYPYLSGMLSTLDSHAQTYGYFEVRARMPEGQGFWVSLWLLPVRYTWPPEIDIAEVLGHETTSLYLNLHSTIAGSGPPFVPLPAADLAADFHSYGVAWRPDEITWYLDGEALQTWPTPADMHEPMHLLATLAVGGNWTGPPDETTPWPGELAIEHVRIFQFDDLVIEADPAADRSGAAAP